MEILFRTGKVFSVCMYPKEYAPQSQSVRVTRDCFVRTCLKPLLFEIEEVTVESGKRENELGELTPSNLLAFSGGDLFSQIWILPGDFLLGWPEFYG